MKFTRTTFNVLRSWSVVMVVVVMMIMVMVVMIMVMVVVMVILSHYDRLFLRNSGGCRVSLVLRTQNLLSIRDGVQ